VIERTGAAVPALIHVPEPIVPGRRESLAPTQRNRTPTTIVGDALHAWLVDTIRTPARFTDRESRPDAYDGCRGVHAVGTARIT